MKNPERRIAEAVRQFWETRNWQGKKQGATGGRRDQGGRSNVTGGAQLDGFSSLVIELLVENGLPESAIYRKKKVELPGFFRPTKEWDLLVIIEDSLFASIEFKSQVGPSFGNNYNNRTEEALGSAKDLWTAYREGAFQKSRRPWLGYFMLLEEAPKSTSPVAVRESHFPVFEEFQGASYAKRYELFCQKLLRERLYDGACFLLSSRVDGANGRYREPSPELTFERFLESLIGRAIAYSRRSGRDTKTG